MEFEKLQKVITDVLNVDTSEVKPETTFIKDLGADSLDIFQIVQGIEEEFKVTLDPEKVKNIKTVQDIFDQIKEAAE